MMNRRSGGFSGRSRNKRKKVDTKISEISFIVHPRRANEF
jgi:hypothetical protein